MIMQKFELSMEKLNYRPVTNARQVLTNAEEYVSVHGKIGPISPVKAELYHKRMHHVAQKRLDKIEHSNTRPLSFALI